MVRTVRSVKLGRRACADGRMRGAAVYVGVPRGEHGCTIELDESEGADDAEEADWSWLIGMNVARQADIDAKLAGTRGALAASVAVLRASAQREKLSEYAYVRSLGSAEYAGAAAAAAPSTRHTLPLGVFTVFCGGVGGGNVSPVRGVCVCPVGVASFAEAARAAAEVYHMARRLVVAAHGTAAADTGLDGGMAPPSAYLDEPLALATRAIGELGLEGRVQLWVDMDASQMYCDGGDGGGCGYNLSVKGAVPTVVPPARLLTVYRVWAERYPLVCLQDPFYAEADAPADDRNAWVEACESLVPLVASSRPERVPRCPCPLLALRAGDTVTGFGERRRRAASESGVRAVALRVDATEDAKDATLAAALGVQVVKFGAPVRGENTAKVNELIRIEEECAALGRCQYGKLHVLDCKPPSFQANGVAVPASK